MVAIVLACVNATIDDGATVTSSARSASSKPSSGARGVVATLKRSIAPVASLATKSVNVPPTSTPTRQLIPLPSADARGRPSEE